MRNYCSPCFVFEPNVENLINAVTKVFYEIGPILINHKNLDTDLESVKSVDEVLAKNGLYITQRVIYENDYELSSVLRHIPSGEQYEYRLPIKANKDNYLEFEKSVKYLKIKSYLDILGLSTINEEYSGLFLNPQNKETISISYTDIKRFFECSRCLYFYKKDIRPPFQGDDKSGLTVSISSDAVLKKEFDMMRDIERAHPIMQVNGIEAVPFKNNNLNKWRESNYGNGGIRFFDNDRNIVLCGVVDDVWTNQQGDLIIVDYKTSSKDFVSLSDEQGASYVRQISFYAWLLKKNNYSVDTKGYLVVDKPITDLKYDKPDYYLGRVPKSEYFFNPFSKADEYKRLLEFETSVITIYIDDSWVEEVLDSIIQCLRNDTPPPPSINKLMYRPCPMCRYYFRLKSFDDKLQAKNKTLL